MPKPIAVCALAFTFLLAGQFPAPAAEPQFTAEQQAQLEEAQKLNKQGMQLDDQAKYSEAEKLYQRR